MYSWWSGLSTTTQVFFGLAVFFSIFFVWQVISALLGFDGDDLPGEGGGGADFDLGDEVDLHDASASTDSFTLLSLRSIVTFFTLFSWGCALYTMDGMGMSRAMLISLVWGFAGMTAVALVFFAMSKLTETGNKDVRTCRGQTATVYLDIPAEGYGEVTALVSGALEHIKAESIDGEDLPAGTKVKIAKVISQSLVGVKKLN